VKEKTNTPRAKTIPPIGLFHPNCPTLKEEDNNDDADVGKADASAKTSKDKMIANKKKKKMSFAQQKASPDPENESKSKTQFFEVWILQCFFLIKRNSAM
jgi:hypothetical protein